MKSANGLYERFRHLIHEALKFGVVGGIGFVITLGGADLLRFDAGLGKYSSVTVATLVATVLTFIGNRYWTFRNRSGSGTTRESILFFLMNGVGLLIQYACIWFFLDALSLSEHPYYNVANLVGVIFGTVFRFFSYRQWVWGAPVVEVLEGHESLEPAGAPAAAPVDGAHDSAAGQPR